MGAYYLLGSSMLYWYSRSFAFAQDDGGGTLGTTVWVDLQLSRHRRPSAVANAPATAPKLPHAFYEDLGGGDRVAVGAVVGF